MAKCNQLTPLPCKSLNSAAKLSAKIGKGVAEQNKIYTLFRRNICREVFARRMNVVTWLCVVVVTSLVTCADVTDSMERRTAWKLDACRQCVLGDRSWCTECVRCTGCEVYQL